MIKRLSKVVIGASTSLILLATMFLQAPQASASILRLSPSSGTFNVGDTIEVEVIVNSENQEINAVEINLTYSADKLEVIAPSIGDSILGIYAAPPKFDNKAGTLKLMGGIPGGVTTPNGVITKIGMRAKAPGNASVQFADNLQVLLNNGRGTESLRTTSGANFKIVMPAGAGPIVTSNTNPDQSKWYSAKTVQVSWDEQFPKADGYSYVYSTDGSASPDDISEGDSTSYTIPDAKEGLSYFFVKALRNGEWGPTTRFIIRSDFTAPNEFHIDISPYAKTKSTKPLFQFSTTDQYSGVDRYELRLIPTNIEGRTSAVPEGERFFSVENPYVVPDELMYGSYQVVVRAYDRAGNITESTRKLEITTSPFWFVSQEGLALPFGREAKWNVVVPAMVSTILLFALIALFLKNWYEHLKQRIVQEELPESLKKQLAELRRYKLRYGKIMPIIALLLIGSLYWQPSARAEMNRSNLLTSYSSQVGENELFFASGRADKQQPVVITLTSPKLPEAQNFMTVADQRGDWLYRHSDPLPAGAYTLTITPQGANGGQPQIAELKVAPSSIYMGRFHMPYLTIYILTTIFLLGIIALLLLYIIVHAVLVHKHRKHLQYQVRHAEDAIKRGFYNLRKDIEAELVLIKQAKLSSLATDEQMSKEKLIEEDLRYVEQIVEAEFQMVEDMIEKS